MRLALVKKLLRAAFQALLGKRHVEVVLAEVVPAEKAAEFGERASKSWSAVGVAARSPAACWSVSPTNTATPGISDVVRVAPPARGPGLDVAVESLAPPRALAWVKMHLADGGAEVTALLGVAGLEDDRLPLRGALDVQRPDDREVLALVVQRVLPGGVKERAGQAVARERVSS